VRQCLRRRSNVKDWLDLKDIRAARRQSPPRHPVIRSPGSNHCMGTVVEDAVGVGPQVVEVRGIDNVPDYEEAVGLELGHIPYFHPSF
jgi:hypothetical protein